MRIESIDSQPGLLVVRWSDGLQSRYPYLWLRDNDPSAFDPETQERIFDLLSVAQDLIPRDASLTDQGTVLRLSWPDRDEASRFDAAWLRARRPGEVWGATDVVARDAWGSEMQAALPRFDASEIVADKTVMLDFLHSLMRTGLTIVAGLDDDENAGIDFARSLGPIRNSNFGETFNVCSKPNPINLAYTSHYLPLHTDLPNQEIPPGFQFLHCLVSDAEGGESIFCDGLKIASDLQHQDPEAFRLLSEVPIPYRFHDNDTDIIRHRPVFDVADDGALEVIAFNPHLAATFDMNAEVLAHYYPAYRAMMAMTRQAAYIVETRLQPGEMVIFDNRRVLHGRARFDPQTGTRHLRGCYVDHHDINSKIRVLGRSA